MSYIEELDNMSYADRLEWFEFPPEEYDGDAVFLSEVAYFIATSGPEGLAYLQNGLARWEPLQVVGALTGLMLSPNANRESNHSIALKYLGNNNHLVAAAAIKMLTELNDRDHLPQIVLLTANSSPYVRSAVLKHLARVHPEIATSRLVSALMDSSYLVRETAIDELDDLQFTEGALYILPMIADPHPDVRQAAQHFLEAHYWGDDRELAMVRNGEDPVVRASALRAGVEPMTDEGSEWLLNGLRDGSPIVRMNALDRVYESLWRHTPLKEALLEEVRQLALDSNELVRESASRVITLLS